jgi:hypothetical protein
MVPAPHCSGCTGDLAFEAAKAHRGLASLSRHCAVATSRVHRVMLPATYRNSNSAVRAIQRLIDWCVRNCVLIANLTREVDGHGFNLLSARRKVDKPARSLRHLREFVPSGPSGIPLVLRVPPRRVRLCSVNLRDVIDSLTATNAGYPLFIPIEKQRTVLVSWSHSVGRQEDQCVRLRRTRRR